MLAGGPSFIAPLLAGGTISPLLEALSPAETPSKIVVATLRTLNQIADAVAQEKPWSESGKALAPGASLCNLFCEYIYTKPVLESLVQIFQQSSRLLVVQQEISLAAKLIAKTCQEDGQKTLLLETGILDQLALRLAAMATVDARMLRVDNEDLSDWELPVAYLPDLTEAISAIIKGSNYNTARFLYSEPMLRLFGSTKDAAKLPYDDDISISQRPIPWERLIPRLHTMQNKTDPLNVSFPALGGADTPLVTGRGVVTEESETPLFIWLMYVARRSEGKTRLSACGLLALLKKFPDKWSVNNPSKTTRERYFAYLVIPLVVKMIEEANPASDHAKKQQSLSPQAREENRFVLERSPIVLADLVAGNKTLQTAAVDAKVLNSLLQILKRSFDPVTTSPKQLWSPGSPSSQFVDPSLDRPSSTLGPPGLSIDLLHAFRYRASALLALAAMTDMQDGLRKVVIDMGVVPHVIESLIPYPAATNDSSSTPSPGSKTGNPNPVLIAACHFTRSLSRSVAALRTSLIDHGVAQPTLNLLKHPDLKVRIAATEVLTNLLLEFSAMRTVSWFLWCLTLPPHQYGPLCHWRAPDWETTTAAHVPRGRGW
jgi:hypothetical protein